MKHFKMILDYLQHNPIIGFIAAGYSSLIAVIKPDDVLLTISAWGGALVIILTVIAKSIDIYQKLRNKKK